MNQLSQPGLGVDLRRLREKAGMSTRLVASKIGVSHASVNRTELGTRRASETEVIALCALYSVVGRQRERLIERARGETTQGQWLITGPGDAEQLTRLMELEMEAASFTNVALNLVPGLLQTPEYARSIISAGRADPYLVEWLVRARMGRQSLLSKNDAPQVHFVLDEFVLWRPVGGTEVMRDQLAQVLRLGERDNVTIQVVSREAGVHAAVDGTFMLLRFPERDPHVYIESRSGGVFIWEEQKVNSYEEVLEDLGGQVLDVPSSYRLIERIRESMACAD